MWGIRSHLLPRSLICLQDLDGTTRPTNPHFSLNLRETSLRRLEAECSNFAASSMRLWCSLSRTRRANTSVSSDPEKNPWIPLPPKRQTTLGKARQLPVAVKALFLSIVAAFAIFFGQPIATFAGLAYHFRSSLRST